MKKLNKSHFIPETVTVAVEVVFTALSCYFLFKSFPMLLFVF